MYFTTANGIAHRMRECPELWWKTSCGESIPHVNPFSMNRPRARSIRVRFCKRCCRATSGRAPR